MRSLQPDRRHDAVLERLFPGRGAHTPAVAGLQSWKTKLRTRRDQIVPYGSLVLEEFVVDHDANSVISHVFRAAVAFAIAIETCQRVSAASLQDAA